MEPGTIGWIDLTVENAATIRDFYSQVVGWRPDSVDMGSYSDYTMCSPADGEPRAGVCHAQGANTGLPSAWLIYIVVTDLDESMQKCVELGGQVVSGPRTMGTNRYCIIQDPGGAPCALYEVGE
jgi:predicted enzyme related to lactoylglutathione lyase